MKNNLQYKNYTAMHPKLSALALIFIIVSAIGLFYYSIKSPIHNWDVLGYAASAVSIENNDVSYIHDYVYKNLRQYASEKDFKFLTENHDYRETMFSDADAFYQQIPFYKIRIVFVLLTLALVKMGTNIFVASHLLAATFTCAGLLVFYYAYRKYIHPIFWFIVPVFFIIFDIDAVARMVTADSIAYFWIGIISYAFLNSKWTLFYILLSTSVLIRTDLIVLVALLSPYLIIYRPNLRIATIISSLSAIAAYLLVNKYAGNYGWSTVFHYAIVSKMQATHPLEYSSYGISFSQFIREVVSNIGPFFYRSAALLFEAVIFIQFTLLVLSQKGKPSIKSISKKVFENPALVLTITSVAYVLIHYILFPDMDTRFFSAQYMIAALGLLAFLSTLAEKQASQ